MGLEEAFWFRKLSSLGKVFFSIYEIKNASSLFRKFHVKSFEPLALKGKDFEANCFKSIENSNQLLSSFMPVMMGR